MKKSASFSTAAAAASRLGQQERRQATGSIADYLREQRAAQQSVRDDRNVARVGRLTLHEERAQQVQARNRSASA